MQCSYSTVSYLICTEKKKGIWSEVHSSSRPLAVPTPQLPNYQSPEMPETAPAPKAREEH